MRGKFLAVNLVVDEGDTDAPSIIQKIKILQVFGDLTLHQLHQLHVY